MKNVLTNTCNDIDITTRSCADYLLENVLQLLYLRKYVA